MTITFDALSPLILQKASMVRVPVSSTLQDALAAGTWLAAARSVNPLPMLSPHKPIDLGPQSWPIDDLTLDVRCHPKSGR